MTTQSTVDQEKQEAFVGKALGDASSALTTVLVVLGDRLAVVPLSSSRRRSQSPATLATTRSNR